MQVRHPGVETLMQRDFTLMMRAARMSRSLPWLADLRLDESVRQFGGPLREQLDLSVEAASLDRFNHNFRRALNQYQHDQLPAFYDVVAARFCVHECSLCCEAACCLWETMFFREIPWQC